MITAVVPTSPIPRHPDTGILEETLDAIRHHLPHTEIMVTFDGVRDEQADRKADYDEYVRRCLNLFQTRYRNILPLLHDEHQHQTGLMRTALEHIDTDLLLYVEHDTPLTTDPILWEQISRFIESRASDLVRFYHEATLQKAHRHMHHGREHVLYERTSQWSQRPHLASTSFYRRIMADHFTPQAKSFIEDRMHGVVDEAYKIRGRDGLDQYRLHIYTPHEGSIQRSYHTDGRAGGPKFEETMTF